MYDPSIFFEPCTEKLRPGDILFLSNFDAYENSYWMVLTSFCDLERRDHIILSRVKPVESLDEKAKNQLGLIRDYRFFYYFYLPGLENEFGESIAHYGMLQSMSRAMVVSSWQAESDCRSVISLSPDARRLFQYHLANHFTRDETMELFQRDIKALVQVLKRTG